VYNAMNLLQFYESGFEYNISQIAEDKELAIDIQNILLWSGLLSTKPDGEFELLTIKAFEKYQNLTNCPKIRISDKVTTESLIDNPMPKSFSPNIQPGDDLAGHVIQYMVAKGYNISYHPDTYNIVYLEGINLDGTENNDEMNVFNDLRMVIQIDEMGVPQILGKWEATTEPGFFDTTNHFNPKGAPRIKFGQYKAWRIGTHNPSLSYQIPALLQEEDASVFRDGNEDGFRTGDYLDTGLFGINQHHAQDSPLKDVGHFGQETLVGRTESGHVEFMNIIMQDIRYKLNAEYLFETAIIAGDDLN
jgi:hypothetical protein